MRLYLRAAIVSTLLATAQVAGAQTVPSDEQILEFLADRVNVKRQGTGTIVGIVTPEGKRVIAVGNRGAKDGGPVDADTVFEIGTPTMFKYEQLIEGRTAGPLAMSSTVKLPTTEMTSRLAVNHDSRLNPVPYSKHETIYSTARDLLTFVEAKGKESSKFFDFGGTDGSAYGMYYDREAGFGIVVLSNSRERVEDITTFVVSGKAPAPKSTYKLDPARLEEFVGRYEAANGVTYGVTRDNEQLLLDMPGLPRLTLVAEPGYRFYVAENTKVTVGFYTDKSGKFTRLVLRSPTGEVVTTRLK